MKANEIKEITLKAKVKPHNMTYPKSGFKAGDFAIVKFDVVEIISGVIPDECLLIIPWCENNNRYLITAKGNMPQISLTSEYILQGNLIIDKTWGPQYDLISLRLDYDLNDKDEQRKFFSFFMTESQVDNLFETVENPIDLLENKNIGELTKVKGIGPVVAQRLCERYEGCKDNSQAYIALKDLDLTKNAIDKLVKIYGSPDIVISKININPYILASEISGYGWKKCDAIAMKKGFSKDCRFRVEAYTKYYLEQQADINGNSWVKIDDLLLAVSNECNPVKDEDLMAWIKEMMIGPANFNKFYDNLVSGKETKSLNEMPLLFYEPEKKQVGLLKLRLMEKQIARHFNRLKTGKPQCNFEHQVCQDIIKKTEEEQGYSYSEEQLKAIWMILDNNVSILSGSAGTGKTSTLSAVTKILCHYNKSIQQCALSGRAACKLTEVTHINGKTIHRLLNYIPDSESFKYTERSQMPYDVIILDETSMVGGEIFLSLIQAVKTGAKFIMVGDHKQLEAIGLANILKDCLSSGFIPSTILTKIHRQAAASGIITQSLHMSNGEKIVKDDFIGSEIRGDLKDFKIVTSFKPEFVSYNIIKEFKDLYNSQHIPVEDIQVIVPMRVRGNISCVNLNNQIQEIVNPGTSPQEVYQTYTENGSQYKVCYKPKDKIIVVKNNYHAQSPDGEEKAIFNGNLGYIKSIYNNNMIINIDMVGDIILPREQWYDINLAYVITCHKLQGSQSPYCIIGLNSSCYSLYSKEWLYTAVTRAQKYCILVTQPSSVNQAIRISHVRTKQTWLQKDLISFINVGE